MSPTRGCRNATTTTKHFLLVPGLLLLKGCCSRLYQSILDTASNFNRENRPSIQRPRDGFLPSFEHLIQLPASLRVHQCICIHERLIKIASQEKSIRSADILHDRVDYIQGRQLLCRRRLQTRIRVNPSENNYGRLHLEKHHINRNWGK